MRTPLACSLCQLAGNGPADLVDVSGFLLAALQGRRYAPADTFGRWICEPMDRCAHPLAKHVKGRLILPVAGEIDALRKEFAFDTVPIDDAPPTCGMRRRPRSSSPAFDAAARYSEGRSTSDANW